MRKFIVFLLTIALFGGSEASWYWPFGSESDAVDEKPKRVSELVEPATLLIEEASDLAAEGKANEAVEKYREALAKLNQITLANSDRAEKPEFATVRNKRAYVNAAIDSLLLNQVKSNAKVVAVSDTTELEKRLDRERWGRRIDKVGESLAAGQTDKALVELDKTRMGTTNAVLISVTHVVVAGAYCQKGAFKSAYRSLKRARQELERMGVQTNEQALTKEEKLTSSDVLQTFRLHFVDGPMETIAAGHRVCAASAALEKTEDLTASNAVALVDSVVGDLDFMCGKLKILTYFDAIRLKEVSTNLFLRSSALLRRMGDEKLEWRMDVSGFRSALKAFEALTPQIKVVDIASANVLKLVEVKKSVPAKRNEDEKSKVKDVERNPPEKRSMEQKPQEEKVAQEMNPKPRTKREQVMRAIEKGDFMVANRLIGEMLVEKPNGAVALNLKAAMEARQGKLKEAEETLDQAIMSNPRNYFAYYNMANLMLQVRPDDKSVAKRYYETGRAFGGPVDAHLEEVLK